MQAVKPAHNHDRFHPLGAARIKPKANLGRLKPKEQGYVVHFSSFFCAPSFRTTPFKPPAVVSGSLLADETRSNSVRPSILPLCLGQLSCLNRQGRSRQHAHRSRAGMQELPTLGVNPTGAPRFARGDGDTAPRRMVSAQLDCLSGR